MAGTKKVTVELRGKETVSDASRQATRSIDNLSERGRSFGETWMGVVTGVNQALELMGKAIRLAGQAYDAAKFGAQAEQVSQAFQSMADQAGTSSRRMIESMQEASAGTIAELDLISSANRAMLFDIPIDKFDELMRVARASATATGASVQQMFDDIVTGIARGSPMILDNLGLTIKIGEATEAYAEQLGKTATELTAAERQQALLNEVLSSGEDLMNRVGDAADELTDLEKYQQLESAWTDLKTNLSGLLNNVMSPLVTASTRFLENLNESFRQLQDFNALDTVVNRNAPTIEAAVRSGLSPQLYESAMAAQQRRLDELHEEFDYFRQRRRMAVEDNPALAPAYTQEFNRRLNQIAEEERLMDELVRELRASREAQQEANRQRETGSAPSTGTGSTPSGGAEKSLSDAIDAMAAPLRALQPLSTEVEGSFAMFVNMLDYSSTRLRNQAFTANEWMDSFDTTVAEMLGETKVANDRFKKALDDTAEAAEGVASQLNQVGEEFTEFSSNMDRGTAGARYDGGWEWSTTLGSDLLAIIGPALQQVANQFGVISAALDPIARILDGFMSIVGPLVEGYLAPIVGYMVQFGKVIGSILLPLMEITAGAFKVLAELFVWGYNKVFRHVFNVLIIAANALQNVFWVFAQALTRVVNGLIDIYNAIRRKKKEIGHVSNPMGSEPRGITEGTLGEITVNDLTDFGLTYGDGSDNTQVYRPPDIHIYQTFEGPVIGTAGMAEVGEFIGRALIDYTGIGGRLIFEDASGNQSTVGVVG